MTSNPPPPTSSWRWHVQRAAIVSRFVAALLVMLISIRFAMAGIDRAMGGSGTSFSESPQRRPAVEPAPTPVVSSRPKVEESQSPPVPTTKAATGRPTRLTLSVLWGPPRSEVYVNGRLVGNTPFLGDTSCKGGMPIRIELIPAEGAPLTYQRECLRGTIEISGPPP